MNTTFRSLVPAALAWSIVTATPADGQATVPLAPFSSIDLPEGGHVTFRRGSEQRVTLVRGSLDHSRFTVSQGGRLIVEKCVARKCPTGYRLEIEVVAPSLSGVSLANGGSIQSVGSFPRQSELTVAVAHGGTIDVRSMPVDRVTASVNQGGRILTVAEAALSATVNQGGVILYWGSPRVRSSVEHGGVVQRGDSRDVERTRTELR